MALKFPAKDPQGVKDYGLDWGKWLVEGETIVASVWEVSSPDLVKGDTSIVGSVCVVWLSGGVDKTTYRLTNRITTSRGVVDERTVTIKVKNQ